MFSLRSTADTALEILYSSRTPSRTSMKRQHVLARSTVIAIHRASRRRGEDPVQDRITLHEALSQTRVHHAVALFGGMKQGCNDDFGMLLTNIFKNGGRYRNVPRHTIPLEGGHYALQRRHFPVTSLESVKTLRAVLYESPMSAALDFHARRSRR